LFDSEENAVKNAKKGAKKAKIAVDFNQNAA
jgi:hypothetical protein